MILKLGRNKVVAAGVIIDPKGIEDLICHEYTAEQIDEDKDTVDFDSAYEEAKQIDMKQKQEQIE